MFVVIATFCARAGEDDAIIALHEDNIYSYALNTSSYHSWQLLRKVNKPEEFLSIAQFANEGLARVAIKNLEKDGWHGRLVSLMEEQPMYAHYIVVRQLH